MKRYSLYASIAVMGMFCCTAHLCAAENKLSLFESPDAKEILAKDKLLPATKHAMPQGCVKSDEESIKLGKILFNDYNNKNHKFKEFPDEKEFGNCIACHQIEKGNGYGNIGPDLSGYRKNFVESGVRTHEWIYQKIADPRVDTPNTQMRRNEKNEWMNYCFLLY